MLKNRTTLISALTLSFGLLVVGCGHHGSTVAPIVTKPAPIHPRQYVVPSGDPVTVKVAAWNLEHFVDPFDDPYVDNRFENSGDNKSVETLQALAYAIQTINADVWVFSEVENDRAVKLFLDNFLPDHDYKHIAGVTATDWYQNIVIASRLPLGRLISLREKEITSTTTDRSRRDINSRIVAAEVLGPGENRFLVIGVHLKAGRTPADVEWRTLQSELIHGLIEHEHAARQNLPIIVAGDFNMFPDAEEFVYLTEMGPTALYSPLAKWGFPYTHTADEPARTLDYILHNDSMAEFYVPESAGVAKPLDSTMMRAISDHLPVVITYLMPQ